MHCWVVRQFTKNCKRIFPRSKKKCPVALLHKITNNLHLIFHNLLYHTFFVCASSTNIPDKKENTNKAPLNTWAWVVSLDKFTPYYGNTKILLHIVGARLKDTFGHCIVWLS